MTNNLSISTIKCHKLDENLLKAHKRVTSRLKHNYDNITAPKHVYGDPLVNVECDQKHLLTQPQSHKAFQQRRKMCG